MIDFHEENELRARIKVVGVGGAGGNALNNMIMQSLDGVSFYAANTDAQALNNNLAPIKIQLGTRLTGGLGAGGNPEVGRDSAMEDQVAISDHLGDADMVFVTAGMGGGTGTGAAPVVARQAREAGALTVGVVTKPFTFEGRVRGKAAERGLDELAAAVDTLIVIPNDRLLEIADEEMSMRDAFRVADRVLYDAVKSISDIIVTPGLINVDFADVKAIMFDQGRALMGTGVASGPDRAREAARMAISSPLLEDAAIDGATGILMNITGGEDMGLREVQAAAALVQESASESANIIFGSVIDETMKDEIRITVVATGFDHAYRHDADTVPSAAEESPELATEEERREVSDLLEAVTGRRGEPAEFAPATVEETTVRRPVAREPVLINPFAEPGCSEYDTPAYTRRDRLARTPVVNTTSTLPGFRDSTLERR